MKQSMGVMRENGERLNFALELSKDDDPLALNKQDIFPGWAKLEFNQCPHCPLDPAEVRWCPAAVAIVPVIETCAEWTSVELVELETIEETRRVIENLSAADALCSMLSNLAAFSACPVLTFEFWIWKYFSPSISVENALFRRLAVQLIYRELSAVRGIEIEPMRTGITMLSETTTHLLGRLRGHHQMTGDAVFNAMVKVHTISVFLNDFSDSIYEWMEKGLSQEKA
jgi:hypothetical protein